MQKISIQDLKHRIALCTADDVVTDGDFVITRKDVLNTWAKIEAKTTSMFSRAGYNVMEDREKQTHLITMRMRRDIDVASSAWVYEERMQSGARWFKVLGIKEDDGSFLIMSARLIERGGDLVPPVETAATEAPGIAHVKQGVVL